MELIIKPKTKRAKKLAKRKEKRRFVKYLIRNKLFFTWMLVQKRRKKITKNSFYPSFLGCRFWKGGECIINDPNFREQLKCKCRIYYQYKQNKPQ